MKKLLILLFAALLLTATACAPAEPTPVEGITGLEVYSSFISKLESGKLYKLHYSFNSWLDFISSESTVIRFAQNEQNQRELVYRDRSPFVIWDYPPYDYYDGSTYYYKYQNTWFVDRFSKYERVQQDDFIGIRERFFTGNDVLSDDVYKEGSGYRLSSVVQSRDKNTYYSLAGKANKDYVFSTIRIKEYRYDYDRSEYRHISTYLFRYSGVNKGKPIARPEDLVLSEVPNYTEPAGVADNVR